MIRVSALSYFENSMYFVSLLTYFYYIRTVNIFCGPSNCYDILGVERTSSISDIKSVSALP